MPSALMAAASSVERADQAASAALAAAAAAAQEKWKRISGLQRQLEEVYMKHRKAAGMEPAVKSTPAAAEGAAGGAGTGAAAAAGPTDPRIAKAPALPAAAAANGSGPDVAVAASGPETSKAVASIIPGTPALTVAIPAAADGNAEAGPSGSTGMEVSPFTNQQHQNKPPTTATAALGGAQDLPIHLTGFSDDLSRFVKYEGIKAVASLRYGDLLSTSNMVCSAAFDRDDEFFATAGVSKRIRIYELAGVLQAPHMGVHYPVLEINSRSRLSSVCWSGYIKSHLGVSDYEGVVQLWDANTNTELMQVSGRGIDSLSETVGHCEQVCGHLVSTVTAGLVISA